MKKNAIRISIKNQLALLMLLFLIAALISDAANILLFRDTLEEQAVTTNSATLETIRTNLEVQLSSIEISASSVRKEDAVRGYVSEQFAQLDLTEKEKIRKDVVQNLFDAIILQSTTIMNGCLIRSDSEYIILNSNTYGLISDSFIDSALKVLGNRQAPRIVTVDAEGKRYYCAYFPVYPDTGNSHGKLLFVLNERLFDSVFGKYRFAGQELYCTDSFGTMVYHSTYEPPQIPENLEYDMDSSSISILEANREYIHLGSGVANSPFYLHLRVSYDSILQQMYPALRSILATFFTMLAVLAFLFYLVIRRFYVRISQLHTMMNHVAAGELEYHYSSLWSDEISDIGYHVNDMVERINSLVVEVSKKELAVKKAQFRSVQMQINPHFLFNTLETIRMVALYHGNGQIARTVKDLSDLFRYTIVSTNPIVNIDQELNHTLKYLDLQKSRAKNVFNTEIDVDPIALNYVLLRLVLQPLVENAITHGIEPKYLQCSLRISIRLGAGRILIGVEDTGVGMSQEQLTQIRKMLSGELLPPEKDEHIGIYNVYERLRLFFGDDVRMNIESEEGQGTGVFLQIPAIRYAEGMTSDALREMEDKKVEDPK